MTIATTTKGGALHWNGPPLRLAACDGTRCAAVVVAIRRFHIVERGWRDVAYSFLICPGCGEIYPGRGWGARTAANGTTAGNREWHAYMVTSGEGEPFTAKAKQAVLTLHAEHRRRFGRGVLTTHRAVRNGTTACAGPEINAWVAVGGPPPSRPEDDVMSPAQEAKLDQALARLDAIERNAARREEQLLDIQLRPMRRGLRALLDSFGVKVENGP